MVLVVFFQNEWCVGKWDPLFLKDEPSIALLELYPILMGLFVWKTNLQNSHIVFRSDNESVYHAVNTQTSKCDLMMVLIRILVLHCLRFNIEIKCVHIPGEFNVIADSLSRMNFQKFRKHAPEAMEEPLPLSNEIWPLLMNFLKNVSL